MNARFCKLAREAADPRAGSAQLARRGLQVEHLGWSMRAAHSSLTQTTLESRKLVAKAVTVATDLKAARAEVAHRFRFS